MLCSTIRNNPCNSSVQQQTIKLTLFYYFRLLTYVGILVLLLQLVQLVPQSTVAALKSIILFVVLLFILIVIKLTSTEVYESVEWFCGPGIVFLKSWTSLFFFAYLIQLPVGLSDVAPAQIISWVFQVCLGEKII